MSGSLILDIAYGIKAKSENDPYIEIAEKGLEGVEASGNQNLIIDIVPFSTSSNSVYWPVLRILRASDVFEVQHIPSWLPGMHWKKKIDLWKSSGLKMRDIPYEWVKDQLVSSLTFPSSLLICQVENVDAAQ